MIPVEIGQGLAIMGAGLAIGIAGLSAIGQGIAAAGAAGATAERPEMFGKGLVFSVLPETQAIYGLLIAILILAGIGLLG
ncbi:MAG: ATPase [Methanocellales archaeon]|nr:ATPase [Methanocellales archaeon]